MSLFGPIYITSTLSLTKTQEMWLRDLSTNAGLIGEHTHGLQVALEAILAKLTEAEPPVSPDLEAASTQLGITTEALRAALAAQPPTS